jgi:hypothetical protein
MNYDTITDSPIKEQTYVNDIYSWLNYQTCEKIIEDIDINYYYTYKTFMLADNDIDHITNFIPDFYNNEYVKNSIILSSCKFDDVDTFYSILNYFEYVKPEIMHVAKIMSNKFGSQKIELIFDS